MGETPEFVGSQGESRNKTDEEHYGAKETENVHWLLAEIAEKPERYEVEVTIEEAVEPELDRKSVV